MTAPVWPSKATTRGPPPGPAAATISSTPSPERSPVATCTPPVKPGKGLRMKRTEPSALYTVTRELPTPAPTADRKLLDAGGTAVTVMVTVKGVEVPPRGSTAVRVNVSTPLKPIVGVYVKVPSALTASVLPADPVG